MCRGAVPLRQMCYTMWIPIWRDCKGFFFFPFRLDGFLFFLVALYLLLDTSRITVWSLDLLLGLCCSLLFFLCLGEYLGFGSGFNGERLMGGIGTAKRGKLVRGWFLGKMGCGSDKRSHN